MSSDTSGLRIPSKKGNRYGPPPEVPFRPDLLRFMPSEAHSSFLEQSQLFQQPTPPSQTPQQPATVPQTPVSEDAASTGFTQAAVDILTQIPPTPPETPIEPSSNSNSSIPALLPTAEIPFQHSQPRFRRPKQDPTEIELERFLSASRVLECMSEEGFASLGEFLVTLFEE